MPEMHAPTADGIKRRACVNCTAGKSKCSPHSVDKCERCHRLGKECVYLNISTRRRMTGRKSRVQLLEKKVDGLVSLLVNPSQQATPDEACLHHGLNSQINEPRYTSQAPLTPPTSSIGGNPTPESLLYRGPSSSETSYSDVIDQGLLSQETAQQMLYDFRTKESPHFPFVILSPDASLLSVRRDSPFLFLGIASAMAVKDCQLQKRLGEEMRTQIHRRVMLGFERSLDLLQGTLVYLAWYQYQLKPQKQQMLLLTQICINLVYELGIEKASKRAGTSGSETPQHSADEVRALQGTYYLASIYSTKLRKPCLMPYTSYMKQAGQWLADREEQQTDTFIPYLMATQELSRRIHDRLSLDNIENTDMRSETLTETILKGFLQELDGLQNSVPRHLDNNATLNLEFPALRAMIQETALYDEFWGSSQQLASSASAPFLSSSRATMLWDSIQSYKSFLKHFIADLDKDAFYLTFATFSKLCSVLAWLAKLINFTLGYGHEAENGGHPTHTPQHPCANMVTGDTELPHLVRQAQHKLNNLAAEIANETGEPDSMTIFSILVGSVLSGYDKRMKRISNATGNNFMTPAVNQNGLFVPDVAPASPILPQVAPDATSLDFFGTLMPEFLDQDMSFQLGAFEDMVWDRMIDDCIIFS